MRKYHYYILGVIVVIIAILIVSKMSTNPDENIIVDSVEKNNTSKILSKISMLDEISRPIKVGNPSGIVSLGKESMIITDTLNKVLWKIEKDKKPELLAGEIGHNDIYNEPIGGHLDGNILESKFETPWEIVEYLDGYIISDSENNIIRYMGEDKIYTFIGSLEGKAGYVDGNITESMLDYPTGITIDEHNNIYISDTGNGVIRKVTPSMEVSTYVGDGALGTLSEPTGIVWHKDVLYIADSGNHRICKVENGELSIVSGKSIKIKEDDKRPTGGFEDGLVEDALFDNPQGIAVDDEGVIYVADTGNGAIRAIKDGEVKTIYCLDDSTKVYPSAPRSMLIEENIMYITDNHAGLVIAIDISEIEW